MQIVKYEINKNILIVGFKEDNFLVLSQIAYDKTKTRQQLLQEAYRQVKNTIDYEKTQTEHFIITNLEGEEFIPEESKAVKVKITDANNTFNSLEIGELKQYFFVKVYDQYNQVMNVKANLTLNEYPVNVTLINGLLTIGKVSNDYNLTLTAEYNGVTDILPIYIKRCTIIPLSEIIQNKINQSKILLSEYLETHPLLFVDGKYYNVTYEKQSLLNNAIAVYQMKVQTGQEAILKWNATGEECTEWTIENITALALIIANYVEPLIAKQQSLEVQMRNCTTKEELEEIVINYD